MIIDPNNYKNNILQSSISNEYIASSIIKIFEKDDSFNVLIKKKRNLYDLEIFYLNNEYDHIFENDKKAPFSLYVGIKDLTFWFRKSDLFFNKTNLPTPLEVINSSSPNHKFIKIHSLKELLLVVKYVFSDVLKSETINYNAIINNQKKLNNESLINIEDGIGTALIRKGQKKYKNNLLLKWDFKCSVISLEQPIILRASHIKPFSQSNNIEKYDVENGLLLSPNLDALFDKFLISFNDNGSIILSNTFSLNEYKSLGIFEDMKLIKITNGMKKYLNWHREKLIQKKKNQ